MKSLPITGKPPGTSEKEIEDYLIKRVKEIGGRTRKFTSPGQRSNPDRICVFPGGFVAFVECKRPGKKLTEKQKRELQQLRDEGHFADWVDSKEKVDAVVGWLEWLPEGSYVLSDLDTGQY